MSSIIRATLFLLGVIGATAEAAGTSTNSSMASPPRTVCGNEGKAALQIIGSGGPLNPAGRASTSYLVWVKNRPSIIVDLGPGSLANLARAGVTVTDLDAVLISHMHPDHVSDLPALLWDEDILDRDRPLTVVGPGSNREFPDILSFLERLFGTEGAFPFMHAIIDPHSRFHLDSRVFNPSRDSPWSTRVGAAIVSAYAVPHGEAPTLAYRIEVEGLSLVFAGDQTGADAGFATFAHHADLLVLHTALSANGSGHRFASVIGTPQQLAALATAAGVKQVVLSHLMALPAARADAAAFSLSDLEGLRAAVHSVYRGPVSIASDLRCISLGGVPQ